ncbi:MAG: hypothetical protein WAV47_23730, partial [Blastocatellia bacterium]
HGVLPMFEHSLVSIIDARRRLLAPGGILIPRSETLWASVVEAPELYSRHTMPWSDDRYEVDLRSALRITTNTWLKARVSPEQLLAKPKCWATLDYLTLESPNVRGELTWTSERAGIGHGLLVWFDACLAEGVSFSNAPGSPELIFGTAFFPWPEAVAISKGDTVCAEIRCELIGEDYNWRWNTRVLDQVNRSRVKADFQQSLFAGALLSSAQLQKLSSDYVPTLSLDGEIDRFTLALMNGEATLGDIAHSVKERFPTRFKEWTDALKQVSQLSQKYGE